MLTNTNENSAHAEMSGTAPGLQRMFQYCEFMEHCKADAATLPLQVPATRMRKSVKKSTAF